MICSVDSELRFERMRAHTGEHIVSGVAHNKFGVDNVGFHMDESCLMTVDFDKYLDNAKIEQLEKEVNKCVMNNLAISCNIYSVEEAEKINFRSKIDFSDNVRIVSIEGIDNCACCAPHLKTTSEVGIVKILSSASHRGGVRINLICGMKAYEDLSIHYKQILNISALLCSKHNEADIAVEKLIENNKALKYRIDEIKTEYFKYIASTFEASEIVFKFFDDFSSDDLRNISNFLAERHNICSFLFSGNDTNGYSYCISSQMLNLKLLCKDFNTVLNGHGGGRGLIFQGRVKATAEQIKKFIDEMSVDNYADA